MKLRILYYNSILKQVLSLLLFLIFTCNTFAQKGEDCLVKNKKAEKLFNEAREFFIIGKSNDAKQKLIEILGIEPDYVQALYELGIMNYGDSKSLALSKSPIEIKQITNKAIDMFHRILDICPAFSDYGSYLYLGDLYFSLGDYMSAEQYYQTFVSENKDNQASRKSASHNLKIISDYFDLLNNPEPYDPLPVEGVTTKRDEYLPLISPNGKYMFYTQRYYEKSKFSDIDKYVENFTLSERLSDITSFDDVFKTGEPMPPPFNDGRNQGGVAISIDNRHLYITICEQVASSNGPYDNCDIYQSDNVAGKWSIPKNLGTNVNGRITWESQPSLSSDGKTLFFTSIRKGNIGFVESHPTSDIYYSELQEDGTWGQATNIGPSINTEGNEKAPFMHSDSKTLYFASDGWPGMGGYDIWLSRMKKNKSWDKPINIGYPINNETDNMGLVVSTFGNKAYFTTRGFAGEGSLDIYSFELPKNARPREVIFVEGQLLDEEGKPLSDATIEVKSSLTQETTFGMVDEKTGKYALAVAVENRETEEFLLTAKKENYAFSSAYIKPTEESIKKPLEIIREIKEVKVGATVEIHDIHFETTSWVFDEGTSMVLENFAIFLDENPNVRFEIHGHTDDRGTTESNQILSEKRAKSVRSYLILCGIDASRMPKIVGHGESNPIAPNTTEEGRAKNRRTEFKIISK